MDHLKLTPKQRLENLTAAYADALEKVQSDLTSKKLRSMVANLKHSIKALCTSYKLTLPELVPVPPLGDPKPKGTTRPQDKPVKKAPAPPKALPRKVAEGEAHPYEPPTAGDLREALDVLLHAPETSYIPTVTDPVCGSAGLPRMEFSKDSTVGQALLVQSTLRGIRRDLFHVIAQLEALSKRGRDIVEEDLRSLDHLIAAALIIADEHVEAAS